MELRVLCFTAYKSMEIDDLVDRTKQQLIFGVPKDILLKRLIVHRFQNIKNAIE